MSGQSGADADVTTESATTTSNDVDAEPEYSDREPITGRHLVATIVRRELWTVVRTRTFGVDIDDWDGFGDAHAEVFGAARPATSMVEVSRLIHPELLVEESDLLQPMDVPVDRRRRSTARVDQFVDCLRHSRRCP